MSETPGRRATRASVRGPSATPAPSVARRPRAKTPRAPAPLPAVATGTSHAYGASGKVTLFTQVDSRVQSSFADRFGAGRVAAVSRDEDIVVPPVVSDVSFADHKSPYVRRRTTTTTSSVRTVADSGAAGDHNDADANDADSVNDADGNDDGEDSGNTGLDSGFSYADGPSVKIVPPATQAEVDAARPWSLAVLWETTLRWVQTILTPWWQLHPWLKTLLLASTLAAVIMFALTDLESLRDSYHRAGSIISNSFSSIPSWKTGSSSSATFENNLVERVNFIENDLKTLRQETQLDHMEIALLREYVPENVMIQKNKATGEWELPLNFWNALREKLSEQGSSIAWETFIRTNQAKLDAAAKRAMEKASPNKHVMTQDMVIEHIQRIKVQVEDELRSVSAKYANTAAKLAVSDLVSASPEAQKSIKDLHDMAFAHLARNMEFALYSVNYFSAGLGAVVDPHLSSPTFKKKQDSRLAEAYYYWNGLRPNPPGQALTAWTEATDCWCAAESDDTGKAQLAVLMALHITPTSITIEHIPARGTLSIGTAPKEFEVWVKNTENNTTPVVGPEHGLDGQCGASPQVGFVCIGKGYYDIHAPSHIQNFQLEAGSAVGFVNKAIIKVKNNWGMAHTCLYRVRFHGDSSPEIYGAEAQTRDS